MTLTDRIEITLFGAVMVVGLPAILLVSQRFVG